MIEIFTILTPVFFLMAAGYAFGRTRLFDEEKASALIAFVWYIAIPALLFRFMASRPLPLDELLLIASYYFGSSADNTYIDQALKFGTGNLAGLSTRITDYVGATKKLVYTAVTEAPSEGNSFVII